MASKLRMDMILGLKNKITPGLKKIESGLDKIQQKVKKLNKQKIDIKGKISGSLGGGRGGGSGGGGSGLGMLAGLGAAGAFFGGSKMEAANKKIQELSNTIGQFQGKAVKLKESMAQVGTSSLSGLKNAKQRLRQYTDQITKLEGEMADLNKEAKKTPGILGRIGRAVVSIKGLAVATTALVTGSIIVGRRYEKLRATLSSVIPPADNVGEAFAFINMVAKQLPTTVEQTAEAFIKMQALGLNPTERKMISFGNTAAAMGKDLMQFVEAVADASVEEFERLKEFGIKVNKDGDKLVMRFKGQAYEIKRDSKSIIDALIAIGENGEIAGKKIDGFAGAAAKQMDTLDGQISNLGVEWNKFLDLLYQIAFEQWAKWVVQLFTWVVKNITKLTGAIAKAATSTIGFFDKLVAKGKMTWNIITGDSVAASVAEYEAYAASVDKLVEKINAETDALVDGEIAGKKYNKVLEERAKKADEAAKKGPLTIGIKGGRELTGFNEFMSNLEFDATEAVNHIDHLWKAQEKADEWFQKGIISSDVYLEMIKRIEDELNSLEEETEDVTDTTTEFWRQAARNMQDAMGNTFFDWMQGKTSDMVGDFKRMIDRMVAELLASKLLNFLVGGFAEDGGALGGIVGKGLASLGFRANGGPVRAGQPYIVGERGPELFTPSVSGHVTSNESMGGNTVNINISAMDGADVRRTLERERRWIAEMVGGTGATYNMGRA